MIKIQHYDIGVLQKEQKNQIYLKNLKNTTKLMMLI